MQELAVGLDHIDLGVFEGNFSCCSMQHKNTMECDKETLMKPLLGIYYNSLVKAHVTEKRNAETTTPVFVERMFPPKFTFTKLHANGKRTHEEWELFGPLVAMMAERAKAREQGSVDLLQGLLSPPSAPPSRFFSHRPIHLP